MAGLAHVLAGSCPGFIQSRTGRAQVHCAGVVAVRAPHGVHYLRSPVTPFGAIVGIESFLTHQTRHVRALASPASAGLHVVGAVHSGIARAQNLP